MRVCKCQHLLPCFTHGAYQQEIMPGWAWVIEPGFQGVLVTLLHEDRAIETRWCADDDGAAGVERLKYWMSVRAGIDAPAPAPVG